MTAPRELLAHLDALHAAGTPGEWATYWGDRIGSGVENLGPGSARVRHSVCEVDDWRDHGDDAPNPATPEDDAELIVAAVNHLPELTAALRKVLDIAETLEFVGGHDGLTGAHLRQIITAALSPAHPMSPDAPVSQR